MKNIKFYIFLIALLLAACESAPDAPITLKFWAMGQEGEQVQALLADFERRYPNIKVRVQQIPWSAAHEKLLTAYAGDALPDVFQLGNTWIAEFIALQAIQPLDRYLADWLDRDRRDYFPGTLTAIQFDGQTWALPWYVDTRLLFYRRDLLAMVGFSEAPSGWDGWLQAMSRLTTLDDSERYAILLPINEWQLPVILAMQRGATLLRDRNQYGDFQNPAFRDAFIFYLSLFEQGFAPPAGQAQVANLYQEFAKGTFATYVSGPWSIGELQRRLPKTLQSHWMTAPLPNFAHYPSTANTALPSVGASLSGGASLALSRKSAHQDAAWKLLEYLSEPAQQARFYELTGDLPARVSAWRQPALAGNVYAQAFWQQLQTARPTPLIPEWERIAQRISYYAELAVRQTLTVDAALAALNADTDRILEKRRWLLAREAAQ